MTRLQESLRARGFVRPRRGRVFGGVCAGIARAFDSSPWLVRLLAVLSLLLPGPQILAYILLWILMPEE